MASEVVTLPGPPPLEIELSRSARARRLSLRVSRIDGRVRMTVPRWGSRAEALAFAAEKEGWLRATLAEQPAQVAVELGASLPIEGRARRLATGTGRRARLEPETLWLPDRAGPIGPRVAAFLKTLARDRLAQAADRHAAALGRPYGRLTLRDTRSRWGSCTSAGDLMFSWRLILAPPEVLDYVAAHEVAHLAEMNHGPQFWAETAKLCPDYKRLRAWLRTHGSGLHRYRFAA